MKTHIRTIHNEEYTYSNNEKKSIGVLLNFSSESQNGDWHESFIFIFNRKTSMYIFFNTIVDMIDYNFYGKHNVRCAYMTEEEFNKYDDAVFINDMFTNKLSWIDKSDSAF